MCHHTVLKEQYRIVLYMTGLEKMYEEFQIPGIENNISRKSTSVTINYFNSRRFENEVGT